MKREKTIAPSLVSAALAMFVGTLAGAAWAQAPAPAYPPGYPPPQYPPPQYPQPAYPPQAPRPAQPPGYPAPAYPPAPGYPQPAPAPRPAQPPGYPAPAPQAPGYPAPAYPPQTGYPQPPPGYPPAQYPQQPGYPQQPPPAGQPGQYPQQPGAPGYPGQYPPAGYDPYAVQAAAASGELQTHRGFYLRGLLGGNYVHNQSKHDSVREGAQGLGGMISLAAGFGVMDNFVIYGELVGYTINGADYEGYNDISDQKIATYKVTGTYNLTGFGPGAAYYIMPLNLYIGGSLMLTFLNPGDNIMVSGAKDPDAGLGLNFSVGKQWAVSGSWCVGAASQLAVAQNDWGRNKYTTLAFGAAFVASFN